METGPQVATALLHLRIAIHTALGLTTLGKLRWSEEGSHKGYRRLSEEGRKGGSRTERNNANSWDSIQGAETHHSGLLL